MFTTARWLDEFGQRLADADAVYFEIEKEQTGETAPDSPSPRRRARRLPPSRRSTTFDDGRRARIRAELEAEGL